MLKEFQLQFQSRRSCPERERRHAPPLTRSVLPALTHFIFSGLAEYLEDFVALINAPLLDRLEITFFRQLISTLHDSLNSPVAHQISWHTTKYMWFVPLQS